MIKYLIMDVDGTLTDGKLYIGEKGEVYKSFSIKDGYGIKNLLIPNNIIPIIITGRQSKIVDNRCLELGITNIYQGIYNKYDFLITLNLDFSVTSYIGDDNNDLDIMLEIKNQGGIVGCPADASKDVIEIADFVSKRNGGDGAVREFIEWILNKN